MNAPEEPVYVVDRFEDGGWAVLEDEGGATFVVPRAWLPDATREGDALRVDTRPEGDELEPDPYASEVRFFVDAVETQRLLERARDLREGLPRGPGGDLEL